MASEIEDKLKPVLAMSPQEKKELRETIKFASLKIIQDNIERMKKTWPDRPAVMSYFDEVANIFGRRTREILTEKDEGKKVIGYTCNFAPIELILAADAVPVYVSSGWYDTAKLGDRIVPVEVCPVIRSTIGAKMIQLSPYLELSDAILNPLTCDGKTKLSEFIGEDKALWLVSPPKVKDSTQSRYLWKEELKALKGKIEDLTGVKITRKKLSTSIKLVQRATRAFRRLQRIRRGLPVIMGRDAMLVNQTSAWDNLKRWTLKTEELCCELEERVEEKRWACPPDTPRVMIAGTPMIWPDNWKVLNLIEESKPQGVIVADELCSSERLLYDPVGVDEWIMNDMLDAVSDRYLLASTCPCFTSENGNEDRINWVINKVNEHLVDGMMYYVIRGCILYAMEYVQVKRLLDHLKIPIYYLDTEYTKGDVGQMKTRIEAFLEMLKN